MYTTAEFQNPMSLTSPRSPDQPVRKALALYTEERLHGNLQRLLASLTRRSNRLDDLTTRTQNGEVAGQHYARTRAVPISQIRGSEGRTADFDRRFHPLAETSKQRWMSVAIARLKGVTLPPVELIQVGDEYYVRDGHHRISVAQALGETAVDADVTVLQVN
jgi:hypothetical protein